MKTRTRLALFDLGVYLATFITLFVAGAGFWALLIFPYGIWNYYDGQTRDKLDG